MKPTSLLTCRSARVHLPRERFVTLRRPRGLRLCVESGCLWVTVDGQPEDIEINAGECRVFDGTTDVVLGTLGGEATLTASWPAPTGLSRLLLQWLNPVALRLPA